MKFKVSKIIEFDESRERLRIQTCFNKTWQKRLLAILDNFEKGDYRKAEKLYDKLPYCSGAGCPGQEFVSPLLTELLAKFVYNAEYYKDQTIEKVID